MVENKLFLDWPWGVKRFPDRGSPEQVSMLLHVLQKLEMPGDAAFFIGNQQTVFPYNCPFPCMSHSPSLKVCMYLYMYVVPTLCTYPFIHSFTYDFIRLCSLQSWRCRGPSRSLTR